MKIKYDDKEYDKIISVSRGYDYSSFSYVDDSGSECSIYLSVGKAFVILDNQKGGDPLISLKTWVNGLIFMFQIRLLGIADDKEQDK